LSNFSQCTGLFMATKLNKKHIKIISLILCAGATPALSADIIYNGDGSASNNPDLLRGSYETGCYYPATCGGLVVGEELGEYPSPKSAPQINNQKYSKNIVHPNIATRTNQNPLTLIPVHNNNIDYQSNLFAPNTKLDWSVSLKGAYRKDYNGERFETILTPAISLSHQNRNGLYNLGAQANLVKTSDSEFSFSSIATSLDGTFKFDRETSLTFDANVAISQEDVNSLNLASNIKTPPSMLNINTNAAIIREFGKLTGALRLGYNRDTYSTTQMSTGLWQDNSARNRNSYLAGLRLTQEITPIINAYVDLSAQRNIFDEISTIGLTTTQNNWALNGRAGLSGNWGDVILADISAGYALNQFDSATLSDSPAAIIDANITYRNSTGLNVSTNFASNITTPDPSSGASLKVGYTLGVLASYQVNDWLRARANARGNWASYVGIDDIERSYSAGVGVDYAFNKYISLNGDYTYNIADSSTIGKRDSHRVEFGLTYSR